MSSPKKEHPKIKSELHPLNKHRERYDFGLLTESTPELRQYVKINDYGDASINFFDPAAVKILNKALLKRYYGIDHWDIPTGYLCPPIPGRADYIHHAASLLYSSLPYNASVKCLDIGTGANCIYPLIGSTEYGWSFIGADIDPIAIQSAQKIITSNPILKGRIELRLQSDSKAIFKNILIKDEFIGLTICNPPFHTSAAAAQSGTMRKLNNLKKGKTTESVLNFGGRNNELWCEGGEVQFVKNMIIESKLFAHSVFWFSTLISKQEHLRNVYQTLEKVGAISVQTIPMGQGNKISRIVAWTFLSPSQQQKWILKNDKSDL